MLLQAARSQLLLIDMQARLMPVILDGERVTRNSRLLIAAARHLGVPISATEQYPQGLGPTVPSIAQDLPEDAAILEKIAFSAAAEAAVAERIAALRAEGRSQVVIAGVEAHVCVLQTALGLRAMGLEVFVVGDAVSSRSAHSVEAARERLLQADGQWVTAEMVAFEWLERAGSDTFRAVSALLKESSAARPRPQ